MNSLVSGVDHVFVPADDPVPLFNLFTETLGLPQSWPVTDYGLMRSGGITFGNCNMEFVTGSAVAAMNSAVPLSVRGIAFEPAAFDSCLEAIDRRKLLHGGAAPEAETNARWTNVFLPGMLGDANAIVFLCEYHEEVCLRGDAARRALADARGGAMGVLGLDEITIAMRDVETATRRWQRLLDPLTAEQPGRWRLPNGPAIRLRSSPIDCISGIVLKVGSLAQAKDALMERDMLGPVRGHGVGLNHSRTHGLDIWLTE